MDAYELMRNVINKYEGIVLPLIQKLDYADAARQMEKLVLVMYEKLVDIGSHITEGVTCMARAGLLLESLVARDEQDVRIFQERFGNSLKLIELSLPSSVPNSERKQSS